MNTNQIPPGVITLLHPDGDRSERTGNWLPKDYDNWYLKLTKAGYLINKISVDGKQWSVGDETNEGEIRRFYYVNDHWCAVFIAGKRAVSTLTKLPSKDSQKEESEFQKFVKERKQSGEGMYFDDEIDEPTPINPSEPEEKSKEEIVQNVLKDAHLGADRSSIKYFLETGTVNGGFMQLINECIMKYTKKQTDEFLAWREALSQCKAEGIDYERGWKAATKAVKLQAAKIQSLQAYNGKLVELLTCIRGAVATVEWNGADPKTTLGRIDNYADKALSSFTDKEIKTSGGGWNDEDMRACYEDAVTVGFMEEKPNFNEWLSSYKKTSGK